MGNFSFKYRFKSFIRKGIEFLKSKWKKKQYEKRKVTSIKTLHRIDKIIVPFNTREIRLFAILRNESLRLPHFLDYYKQLGVDRFFFVDNNSDDDSAKIILKQYNCHLYKTTETYANHWFWMEYLLDTYGKDHWCMVVDIDELFCYPNSNKLKLPQLIKYFEIKNITSIASLLLDLYSNKSVLDINFNSGDNPLNILKYFDRNFNLRRFTFWDWKNMKPIYVEAYSGGMRERVFGKMNPTDILTKISLFKYCRNVYLSQGMHSISNTKTADINGVVLHTKFLNDFIFEVIEEVKREQHYDNGIRYKHFTKTIKQNNNLTFFYNESVELKDINDLAKIGLMNTSASFELFCDSF
jgi:hypothetical protein